MVMSMVLPVLTAAAMGAGLARLTFLMLDLFEDEATPEGMDARIAALDQLMRRLVKPKTIETSCENDDSTGVYKPKEWPTLTVRDLLSSEVENNCGPCVQSREDEEEGPVRFVKASQFTSKLLTDEGAVERRPCATSTAAAAAAAASAASRDDGDEGNCYICFERNSNSILLPCGHSGVCYQCAIENVARCETCPCCRHSVNQVVVYDRDSVRRDGDSLVYSVIGPGMVKAS